MFLGSALRRGSHPPENILKFNLPGPLFRALAENMAASYFGKNYLFKLLRFPLRSETSVCKYSVIKLRGTEVIRNYQI
jgi:hypothetical protein